VLRKRAAHRKQSAADKPYGTGAFEVLGAIFFAGALAVAQSPHAVQLLRLRPRRTQES